MLHVWVECDAARGAGHKVEPTLDHLPVSRGERNKCIADMHSFACFAERAFKPIRSGFMVEQHCNVDIIVHSAAAGPKHASKGGGIGNRVTQAAQLGGTVVVDAQYYCVQTSLCL